MSDQALAPSTDESLLVRIRDPHDAAAWHTFVDLYLPLIYGYCRRLGLQDADAQNASQEVFASISRAINRFEYDPRKGRFRGWLGSVARHQAMRQRQRDARVAAAPGDGADDSKLALLPADNDPQWIDEFNRRVCHAALERIREEFDELTWRAFALTWQKERPAGEVAQELGKPRSWVYIAKFRVVKRLKEEVRFLTDDVGYFQQ